MKKSLMLALSIPFVVGVSVSKEVKADNIALNLCTYVQADDRQRMRQQLRDSRVRLRSLYDGVVCNGLDLLRFSIENNSLETAEFIISQLPASSIDIQGINDWSQENGYGNSKVLIYMSNRVN